MENSKKYSWSAHYADCVGCGTTEIPHTAKGLCKRCYGRSWRNSPRSTVPWRPKGWSRNHEHCVSCGTTERRHAGKGLCTSCYSSNSYHSRNRARILQGSRANYYRHHRNPRAYVLIGRYWPDIANRWQSYYGRLSRTPKYHGDDPTQEKSHRAFITSLRLTHKRHMSRSWEERARAHRIKTAKAKQRVRGKTHFQLRAEYNRTPCLYSAVRKLYLMPYKTWYRANLTHKHCSACGLVKPVNDFYRRNSLFAGRSPSCKECQRRNNRANREQLNAYAREYRKRNPDKLRTIKRASKIKRKAAKKSQGEITLTTQELETLFHTWDGTCAYCGEPTDLPTTDHIVPLAENGDHTLENVIIVCASCNSSKNAKPLLTWVFERGLVETSLSQLSLGV